MLANSTLELFLIFLHFSSNQVNGSAILDNFFFCMLSNWLFPSRYQIYCYDSKIFLMKHGFYDLPQEPCE